MSRYIVQIFNSCRDLLDDLKMYNIPLYNQFCDTIREIKSNPFKSKFKKLENSDKDRRARSGGYRIIYYVKDNMIFITKIGLRKDVYKKGVGCQKFKKKKLKSI